MRFYPWRRLRLCLKRFDRFAGHGPMHAIDRWARREDWKLRIRFERERREWLEERTYACRMGGGIIACHGCKDHP